MREFRRDPVRQEWVIIDGDRPLPFSLPAETTPERVDFPETHPECPFCPGRENLTGKELFRVRSLTGRKPEWDVRVVPNRLPLLRVETEQAARGNGMYDWMSGVGADEVVIESPRHGDTPSQMTAEQLARVFPAWRERILDLRKDQRLHHVRIVKRTVPGGDPVADHPHSRIVATPFVPSDVKQRMINMKHYHETRGRCVVCDMVHQELADRSRIIAQNDHFVAFLPYASLRPFETWIVPRMHMGGFEQLQTVHDRFLAEVVMEVSRKLIRSTGREALHMTLYSRALNSHHAWDHWYLELFPLVSEQYRFSGDGDMRVNPVVPEEGAVLLKEGGV